MNLIEHAVLALAVQALLRLLTGSWWISAAAASAYFLGREAAQAEYRWIETFGAGLRANMPWWGPFDLRVWPKLDQWADWIAPLLATHTLAYAMHRRR